MNGRGKEWSNRKREVTIIRAQSDRVQPNLIFSLHKDTRRYISSHSSSCLLDSQRYEGGWEAGIVVTYVRGVSEKGGQVK